MFTRLFILAVLVHLTRGYTIHELNKLTKNKLALYNKNQRPIFNQSLSIEVYSLLQLIAVKEFDEITEKLTIIVAHGIFWKDEMFSWDPKDNGGIETITVNESEVWKPTIILLNTFDKLQEVGGSSFPVRINSSGIVSWIPGSVLSATCQVDITYYPWDTQICSFELVAWGFFESEIQLRLPDSCVVTSHHSPSGIWELLGSNCYSKSNVSQIFQLSLKRKPMFIFVNVILPILFMCCLNLLAFLIPTESGERMSYCITVLLSIAVFLTIVSNNLPKTSNPMSILSYYLISVLGLSICITFATICSLRIYFKDERESMSTFWRTFVRLFRRKMAREARDPSGGRESSGGKASEERSSCTNQTTASWFSGHRYNCNKSSIYKIETDSLNGDSSYSVPTRNRSASLATPADNTARNRSTGLDTSVDNITRSRSTSLVTSADNNDTEPDARMTTMDEVCWKDVSATVDKLCFVLFLLLYVSCSTWSLVRITWNV